MAIVDLADLGMHFLPALPTRLELAAIVIALGGALWFAKWYPQQIKTHRSLSAEPMGFRDDCFGFADRRHGARAYSRNANHGGLRPHGCAQRVFLGVADG